MAVEQDPQESDSAEAVLRRGAYLILAILPVLLFATGSWNLFIASEMAGRSGSTLPDLFAQWRDGLDLTGRYSQSYLIAMKRLSNAIYQISTGIVTLFGAGILLYANRGKKT